VIPKKKAGSYMGIWDISTLLPQVISPLIAGLIYTLVYIYNAAGIVSLAAIWKNELPKEDSAAAALGVKWVMISLIGYFAIALWVLRKVREERANQQAAA
jgi:MFS family permease